MSKTRLPVIVGFGGYNAAGRSSFHQGYQRMVLESLGQDKVDETVVGLATLTGMVTAKDGGYEDSAGNRYSAAQVSAIYREAVEAATLVRRVEKQHFDVDACHWHKNLTVNQEAGGQISFIANPKQLPEPLPTNWQVIGEVEQGVRVQISGDTELLVNSYREFPVKSAGQLPTGFEPGAHYSSRFHPRGLQMAILGASDAVHSLGIDWSTIVAKLPPDQIGVYASSVMSQMDEHSNAGLLQSRLRGGRASSKQVAMGLNTMPADFINAYVLGSVGVTGSTTGACATFLYTLRQGLEDIQSGRRRVVLVGGADASVTPEIMEGYNAMSALASDDNLRYLDKTDNVDYRRASRPFGENCGFVMGESTQWVVLMDDELAIELGADIYGAVPGVFINADGFKKSISAPGPGNYITFAKSAALIRSILGEKALKENSFIQAHGSSTPQNRVTESLIFDRIAKAFGIENWPVAAIKAFVGHTLGPASGDQLIATMGVFAHNILPGIKTITEVADDVYADKISISNKDRNFSDNPLQVAFLNSKGFGGNNATASVLSPTVVEPMLAKRYGQKAITEYHNKREKVREAALQYHNNALNGKLDAIYQFGQNMIDDSLVSIDEHKISIPGFANPVELDMENPYEDMQ